MSEQRSRADAPHPGIGDQGDSRRLPARPGHRSGQRADLRQFDVRPGRRRRAAGGFEYADRQPDPRCAFEASLAAVEDGSYGRAFGSGMAADCALRALLRPGIMS